MALELYFIQVTPSDWTNLINAISHLVEVLVGVFGPRGTALFLIILFVSSIAYRRYREYRKDSGHRAVVAEKERTIQRLAEENRNYRIVILKEIAGWTDDEIDHFVMKNEFTDGVIARRVLEGEEEENRQPRLSAKRSNKRRPRGERE